MDMYRFVMSFKKTIFVLNLEGALSWIIELKVLKFSLAHIGSYHSHKSLDSKYHCRHEKPFHNGI